MAFPSVVPDSNSSSPAINLSVVDLHSRTALQALTTHRLALQNSHPLRRRHRHRIWSRDRIEAEACYKKVFHLTI